MLVKAISGRKRDSEGATKPNLILQSHSSKNSEVLVKTVPQSSGLRLNQPPAVHKSLTTIGRVQRDNTAGDSALYFPKGDVNKCQFL